MRCSAGPGGEKPGIQRIDDWRARLQHLTHGKPVEQRRYAADVVEVGMRDHHCRDGPRAVPLQERDHHPGARVAPVRGRPDIDDHPPALRRAQHGAIALPDVEKM